jgi:hypothetical protein
MTLLSATGIAYFVISVCPVWVPPHIANAVQISGIALSVATTTVSTIIIVTRILLVSRMPGASKQPRLAAEIITESAALYSISALIYISLVSAASSTTVVLENAPRRLYGEAFFTYLAVSFLSAHLSIIVSSAISLHFPSHSSQNFAPAFIMLRVALGRARPDTEWSGKISGLEFSSNPGGGAPASATGRFRSQGTGHGGFGTNTILTVPRSNFQHEVDVDIEARDTGSDMDAVAGKEKLQ